MSTRSNSPRTTILVEVVEGADEELGQAEGNRRRAVQEGHLGQRPPTDGLETGQQDHDGHEVEPVIRKLPIRSATNDSRYCISERICAPISRE